MPPRTETQAYPCCGHRASSLKQEIFLLRRIEPGRDVHNGKLQHLLCLLRCRLHGCGYFERIRASLAVIAARLASAESRSRTLALAFSPICCA